MLSPDSCVSALRVGLVFLNIYALPGQQKAYTKHYFMAKLEQQERLAWRNNIILIFIAGVLPN